MTARAPAARLTIASRLTLALAAVAIAVFAAVGLLLHWTLQRALVRGEQDDIQRSAEVVRHFIDEAGQAGHLADLAHHLDDTLLGDPRLRVWLIGSDGRVWYGGSERPAARHAGDGGRLRLRAENGAELSGRAFRLEPSPALPFAELLVALDTRGREQLTRRYATTMALVCGLGVALSIGLGGWTARRALRPLRQLADEAAALSPEALTARLSTPSPPELARLAAHFNQALDRVEASYQRLEAFNADVAHELRTPLTTLISGTEVALSRPRTAAELQDTLASNLEDLRQLASMINDMLFLARAGQPRSGDLPWIDLREQALQVADFFDAQLEASGQRLLIEGRARAPASAALVRRALTNLLANASRYTPAGAAIVIALQQDERQSLLSVRNPGPTIDPEALPRLFDRFYRADPARSGSADRHGLGLAIVRAIARMHGGETRARSSGGVTEVGFSLSLAAPPEPASAGQTQPV